MSVVFWAWLAGTAIAALGDGLVNAETITRDSLPATALSWMLWPWVFLTVLGMTVSDFMDPRR